MIRMIIAGDLVIGARTQALLEENKVDELFADLRLVNASYDYRMLNLECPIITSTAEKALKKGPHLKCDEKVIGLLKYGFFDGVTLSNNHLRDYGDVGVANTLRVLDEHGIDHVGGGKNEEEAARTLYKNIQGERLAIINCSEHEFSIASKTKAGANPLNIIKQYYAIQEARSKADYVVLITHGGVEKYDKPTPRMQETYRFFIDAGADAVVNHHQHCHCGYEVYKEKPIFYGLGNLCFDLPHYRQCSWNKGFVVGLSLDKQGISFKIFPYIQSDEKPGVVMLEGDDKRDFEKAITQKNTVIQDAQALEEAQLAYVRERGVYYSTLLTPYSSKLTDALYSKGLLPSFCSQQKWLTFLNKMECESHRDNYILFTRDKLGI